MRTRQDIFDAYTAKAVEKCLESGIPFALVIMPGSNKISFFCSLSSNENPLNEKHSFKKGFSIGFFGKKSGESIYIAQDFSAEDIVESSSTHQAVKNSLLDFPAKSTDWCVYRDILQKTIDKHKTHGGKTVISRIILKDSTASLLSVASIYFSSNPYTFRALYYTPETGLWIVATPELLYRWNSKTEEFHSMSLAGTRVYYESGYSGWDKKNKEEHNFVTKHICDVFNSIDVKAEVEADSILKYGQIEHLCNKIRGKTDIDAVKIIDLLNPTPAVCGFPVEEARKYIHETEPYDRRCYGGVLTICDGENIEAYVNLRCARIRLNDDSSMTFAIYAGGGVTAQSQPMKEWEEAASKAAPLMQAIDEAETIKISEKEQI